MVRRDPRRVTAIISASPQNSELFRGMDHDLFIFVYPEPSIGLIEST